MAKGVEDFDQTLRKALDNRPEVVETAIACCKALCLLRLLWVAGRVTHSGGMLWVFGALHSQWRLAFRFRRPSGWHSSVTWVKHFMPVGLSEGVAGHTLRSRRRLQSMFFLVFRGSVWRFIAWLTACLEFRGAAIVEWLAHLFTRRRRRSDNMMEGTAVLCRVG